ncbi:hypothetical protein [Xanthobacter flavus]|uniref:hypothetical protein n=1 Tax=Xanthobacter flavus TaxID=281 RepID=UPI0037281219
MTKIVRWSEAEIAEPADYDRVGAFAREGDEALAGAALGYPHHWSGFTISHDSAVELTINRGNLFVGTVEYAADDPIFLNLQIHLPLVTGDRRWIALLLRGASEVVSEQRMIETDAETHDTVSQAVPKVDRRFVEIVVQQGLPSPTPLKPTVAADQCCLAFVELATTGIVGVEMDNASRVKGLYEVEGRLAQIEGDVANTIRRTTTLETDVANIAARLGDIPRPEIMRQIKRDLAILRRNSSVPDDAVAYWFDPCLTADEWDTTHGSWLARVHEGMRFGWAAERDAQLALLDPASTAIRLSGSLLMPAWTEAMRIEVEGDGGSVNISQLAHTVTTAIQRQIARTSIEYGKTVKFTDMLAWWHRDKVVGETFTRRGEEWGVVAVKGDVPGFRILTIGKVIRHEWLETYWDYETENVGLNGSTYAQTWLNSQPLILTSIELDFVRVGSTGDVHLLVCECSESGAPDPAKVIVTATLSPGDISTGWTKFSLRPSLLESGKRYAWMTVTTGNHALATATGNKFAQGTMFLMTDGAFMQGDQRTDFAMRINAARFGATRAVVEMQPLTLGDGMTDIRILTAGWTPGGTSLTWEVQPSGATAWTPVVGDEGETDPLPGLPALVRLRAVFAGTTDLMPAVVLDVSARGETYRPRNQLVGIGKVHDFGLSTSTVQMETVVDDFDAAKHTAVNRLMVGATVVTPASTSTLIDADRPERRTLLSTFNLGAPASAVRPRVEGDTTEITDLPFVESVALYAL